MIKHVDAGYGITVTGYSIPPYVSPGAQSAGMTRYNTNMQCIEVYDGNSWLNVSSTPNIALSPDVVSIIDWARTKMQEEQQLKKLMEKHPGLRDTYEKFELMKALCQEEKDNATR